VVESTPAADIDNPGRERAGAAGDNPTAAGGKPTSDARPVGLIFVLSLLGAGHERPAARAERSVAAASTGVSVIAAFASETSQDGGRPLPDSPRGSPRVIMLHSSALMH
jgi:hypothetical protein